MTTLGKLHDLDRLKTVLELVQNEASKAMDRWPPFNSAHEGFAVLQEEVDELWDLVKLKQSERVTEDLIKEAVQVAAMAARFIVDVCREPVIRK